MKSPVLPLLCALALPLFTLDLCAQEPPALPQQKPVPAVISLSFQGGSMEEFVAQMRAKEPRANVIVAEGAKSARLPAIDLRGAGLEQALEGACTAATSKSLIRVKEFSGAGEPVFAITATEPMLTMRGPNAPGDVQVPAAVSNRPLSEVYSLNRLLDMQDGMGFEIATVLSAIEAATAGEGAAPVLRFHKESGLLIVRASSEQVHLVHEVLTKLERDVKDRRAEQSRKVRASDTGKEQAK